MSLSEFELIFKYFSSGFSQRHDVLLGIGDDCALLDVPQGQHLAVTMDTMVEGVHFFDDANPYDLGYKILAVNLSDLAAMGAEPAWTSLALTLPHNNEAWLQEFCKGWETLARAYNVQLIGGDTSRGHLTLTVQAHGFIPGGAAICRRGAMAGDLIYVSGTLGDAGLALLAKQGSVELNKDEYSLAMQKLNRPEPRIDLGKQLRGLATSAIDISDGLCADLGHILKASEVGANIAIEKIPMSTTLNSLNNDQDKYDLALGAGDDYELCFTIPKEKMGELEKRTADMGCTLTCIGEVVDEAGLHCYLNGKSYETSAKGFQHF
jgi:thiamine-monophosphate kinase